MTGMNYPIVPPSHITNDAQPVPHPDLLASTVSCSGTEITIQCNNHGVKDRLMDFLTGDASQPSPAATVETLNEQAREHPRYDNPRDPFASPDRLPEQSADNEEAELDAWVDSLPDNNDLWCGWHPVHGYGVHWGVHRSQALIRLTEQNIRLGWEVRRVTLNEPPAATVETNQFETTKAGVIDWKMEAERANRLLAQAERPKCRLCGLEDGACICAHLPPRSSADNADELKQCHDDLDTLNVPRLEGGLTLSVPGRILLMARRHRMTLPNADWLRRKTETDPDLECEAGPDLSRDGPQAVPDGYALVPLTPTPEMIEVGCDNNPTQWNEGTNDGFAADVASEVYVSMVRAASQLSRPQSRTGEA